MGKDFADAVATIGKKASTEGFDPMLLLSDLLTAPVTARSTLDASFYLRQGWKMAPRHPKAWTSSIKQGMKASISDNAFERLDSAIVGDDFLVPVGTGAD